jgi:quercetin dioxygenase-like cupin family protein
MAEGRDSEFWGTLGTSQRQLGPGLSARLAWGERIMFSLLDMAPHSVVPRHSHPHEQMGLVLEGEFELAVGTKSRVLRAGDVYLVPPGVEHEVRVGALRARVVDAFSPPREDYK